MNKTAWILVLLLSTTLAGCSSSANKADDAKAAYMEEKTKTLQEYKACVKDADGDEQELKQCEALLKAVEAGEKD